MVPDEPSAIQHPQGHDEDFEELLAFVERHPAIQPILEKVGDGVRTGTSVPAKDFKAAEDALREAIFAEMPLRKVGAGVMRFWTQMQTHIQLSENMNNGVKLLEGFPQGKEVPFDELYRYYDSTVFMLQVCDEPDSAVPDSSRSLLTAWWRMIVNMITPPLAQFCEACGLDSTPLHEAAITPDTRTAITALTLFKRADARTKGPRKCDVGGGRRQPGVASVQTTQGGEGRGVRSAKVPEVRATLLKMAQAGRPYSSLRELGTECGCVPSTVKSAIDGAPELKAWAGGALQGPRPASTITPILAESLGDRAASDPSDILPDEDVDEILGRLVQDVSEEERGRIHGMDKEERRKLARHVQEHQADFEPSSAEANPRGGRPLKVRQFKRA